MAVFSPAPVQRTRSTDTVDADTVDAAGTADAVLDKRPWQII